jgi:hypothetical protein
VNDRSDVQNGTDTAAYVQNSGEKEHTPTPSGEAKCDYCGGITGHRKWCLAISQGQSDKIATAEDDERAYAPAQPLPSEPKQEREYRVHKAHCFRVVQPENEFMGCKYGPDEECPVRPAQPLPSEPKDGEARRQQLEQDMEGFIAKFNELVPTTPTDKPKHRDKFPLCDHATYECSFGDHVCADCGKYLGSHNDNLHDVDAPTPKPAEGELREQLKTLAYDTAGRLPTTKHEMILEAEQAIEALYNAKLEAAGERLGIYAPTMGKCGVCGQRPYQHTCDQALEAIQRWYGSKDNDL